MASSITSTGDNVTITANSNYTTIDATGNGNIIDFPSLGGSNKNIYMGAGYITSNGDNVTISNAARANVFVNASGNNNVIKAPSSTFATIKADGNHLNISDQSYRATIDVSGDYASINVNAQETIDVSISGDNASVNSNSQGKANVSIYGGNPVITQTRGNNYFYASRPQNTVININGGGNLYVENYDNTTQINTTYNFGTPSLSGDYLKLPAGSCNIWLKPAPSIFKNFSWGTDYKTYTYSAFGGITPTNNTIQGTSGNDIISVSNGGTFVEVFPNSGDDFIIVEDPARINYAQGKNTIIAKASSTNYVDGDDVIILEHQSAQMNRHEVDDYDNDGAFGENATLTILANADSLNTTLYSSANNFCNVVKNNCSIYSGHDVDKLAAGTNLGSTINVYGSNNLITQSERDYVTLSGSYKSMYTSHNNSKIVLGGGTNTVNFYGVTTENKHNEIIVNSSSNSIKINDGHFNSSKSSTNNTKIKIAGSSNNVYADQTPINITISGSSNKLTLNDRVSGTSVTLNSVSTDLSNFVTLNVTGGSNNSIVSPKRLYIQSVKNSKSGSKTVYNPVIIATNKKVTFTKSGSSVTGQTITSSDNWDCIITDPGVDVTVKAPT